MSNPIEEEINRTADEICRVRASMAGLSREDLAEAQLRLDGLTSRSRRLWVEKREVKGREKLRPQLELMGGWQELRN